MPHNKRKKIYVIFPYNSGAGPDVNTKLMRLYYEYYCLHRDMVAPDEYLFIPHIAINPNTKEHKAMKRCISNLLQSKELWCLNINIKPWKYYPEGESNNIILERAVARAIGINTYNRYFPDHLIPQALEILGMKE